VPLASLMSVQGIISLVVIAGSPKSKAGLASLLLPKNGLERLLLFFAIETAHILITTGIGLWLKTGLSRLILVLIGVNRVLPILKETNRGHLRSVVLHEGATVPDKRVVVLVKGQVLATR
jgi:hypothetical protein